MIGSFLVDLSRQAARTVFLPRTCSVRSTSAALVVAQATGGVVCGLLASGAQHRSQTGLESLVRPAGVMTFRRWL